MVRIEMTPYEQKDILDVLEFAKQEYIFQESLINKGLERYWINRIEELKKVIEGKVNPPSMERKEQ